MINKSLHDRVVTVVAQIFQEPGEAISNESSSETIKLWDSLGHLNLMLGLEQEFGVRLTPQQMEKMTTVKEIVSTLQTMVIAK
jgi:acyl carrier protein